MSSTGGKMEKRAIQVSHQLWAQVMTEGYTSGGVRCIEGLPEDARFVTAFYREMAAMEGDPSQWSMVADPVFVFESDRWSRSARGHTVIAPWGEEFPAYDPVFRVAECRTCKWWDPTAHHLTGECRLTRDDDFVPVHAESTAHAVASVDDPHPISWLQTEAGFGCTQYGTARNR